MARHSIGIREYDIKELLTAGGELVPARTGDNSLLEAMELTLPPLTHQSADPSLRDRTLVRFRYQHLDTISSLITRFAGTVSLITSEGQLTLEFDDLFAETGLPFKHPELVEAGIQLIPTRRWDQQLLVTALGENALAIESIEVMSMDAKHTVPGNRQIVGGKTLYYFYDGNSFPEKVRLQVVLNRGLKTIIVPFAFENLPVPPALPHVQE